MEVKSSYIYSNKRFPVFEKYIVPGLLQTEEGDIYYDLQSFVCTTSLWTSDLDVQSQFQKLPTVYEYPSKIREKVSKGLLSLVNIKKEKYEICYSASGTDSVVNAINLSRQITGKRFVFVFNDQYHGKYGMLSGRSSVFQQQQIYGEDIIVFPSLYNGIKVLTQLDQLLKHSIYTNNVASILIEPFPIANGGGKFISNSTMEYIKKICDFYKIPLIIDEVQSGFWRTGLSFSYMWYKLKPFAIAFGKSIAGGLPLYGTFFDSSFISKPPLRGFYSSTYAFSLAAGSVALQILQRIPENFPQIISNKGKYFDLAFKSAFSGKEYMRKGLLISFPTEKTSEDFLKYNLFVRVINNRLLLTPPLFTEDKIIRQMVERLKDAII